MTRHGVGLAVKSPQPSLFAETPDLPDGLAYAEEIITPAEEATLTHYIAALPLTPFEFVGGLKGKRQMLSFGFRYDWGAHPVQQADEMIGPRRE